MDEQTSRILQTFCGLVERHFNQRRRWTAAMVKHPRGDLLIDTSFGRRVAGQLATVPPMLRAITSSSMWQPAADQLGSSKSSRT